MKRRGIEMRLVIDAEPPKVDNTLIKVIARAHAWVDDLISGRAKTIAAIASRKGYGKSYVRYVMKLAFLAPHIVETIVAGRQAADLTAEALIKRTRLPLKWAEQRRLLGFV
jgi:hypothetical protein